MRAHTHTLARAHWPLLVLLLAGLVLRAWFVWSYRPAFIGYPDARAYLVAAHDALYFNQFKTVGYPLFLQLWHAIDARLTTTIVVQHLLGLGTAVLLYAATVRHVRRSWAALLPAAVVLFGGSQVFLEHAVMSDAPFTFVIAAACWCVLRSRGEARSAWWLAAAGALLAVATTLRTVGAPLLPLVAACALAGAASWRERAARVAAVLVPAVVVMAVYLIPQHAETGSWGLTRTTGFALYGRMAPLADCTRFTPPAGTARLCERSDPSGRPNANYYLFAVDAPARRLYGVPPYPLTDVPESAYRWRGEEPTREFASAVLRHQPLDFLASVLEGLANYVVPRAGRRSVIEYDHETLVRELHNARFEQLAIPDLEAYDGSAGYHRRNVGALDDYANAAETEGVVLALLALLALGGLLLARGPDRYAALLFAVVGFALALVPVATLFYDERYATPVVALLACGAAIGTDRIAGSVVRRRAG